MPQQPRRVAEMRGEPCVLVIDEGTTGTRAGLVDAGSRVSAVAYRPLKPPRVDGAKVESDPEDIWQKTRGAAMEALASAQRLGLAVRAVGISNQRATALMWDTGTGEPLTPAVTWQDTRYARELGRLAPHWDLPLRDLTGRTVGVRSPYFWAARQLEESVIVRGAWKAGRLAFGTIDTWLVWRLTSGSAYAASATNVCAAGAYELRRHRYAQDWLDHLGFPASLLPELRDDGDDFGTTSIGAIGAELPITAAIGDQLAGMIGLGAVRRGDVACLHGTGSFVDVITGAEVHHGACASNGVVDLLARRENGCSVYSTESFTPSTGAALSWICGRVGLFRDAEQLSAEAQVSPSTGGVTFLPALAGMRSPVTATDARGALTGLSLETTRSMIASAVLEGIAQSTVDALDAVTDSTRIRPTLIKAGGGISRSDALLQFQADLSGVPVHRLEGADEASLRGAALLAGARGILWHGLDEASHSAVETTVFEPGISDDERLHRRALWRRCIDAELERLGDNAPRRGPA